MAQPKSGQQQARIGLSQILFGLLVLAAAAAVVAWRLLPPGNDVLLAGVIGLTIAFGLGALFLAALHLRLQRALAWRRAIREWSQSVKPGGTPTFSTAAQLLPRELDRFAAQVYGQMGYRVIHPGRAPDQSLDLTLVSREGHLELVRCIQRDRPVGESEVHDLSVAMGQAYATRGCVWAPGGFSASAVRSAQGTPISLADSRGIRRLVENAYRV